MIKINEVQVCYLRLTPSNYDDNFQNPLPITQELTAEQNWINVLMIKVCRDIDAFSAKNFFYFHEKQLRPEELQ